jgi:arabinogalactan oligomer / maltooligosaccharide transport system permease protein
MRRTPENQSLTFLQYMKETAMTDRALATPTSTRPVETGESWFHRTQRTRTIILYLLPAFLVMSIITFYPLLYQVWMSTTDYGVTNLRLDAPAPNSVGLQNYVDIFTGGLAAKVPSFNFVYLLGFNLWWTFSNVIFHVSLGILIALLVNQKGLWFKTFYRAIYVVPIILPTLVIATVWRNMFDPDIGAINLALAGIGSIFGVPEEVFHIRWFDQIDRPISWIPLPLSYFAILLTNIWLGWPFMTIVATAALQSIPPDLYEAADMDGANGWNKFWKITLPMLRPAMVPATVYGLITTFNLFNLIYFTSRGGPLRQTEIMVTTAYRLVKEQQLYGVAAAFCVLIFLILLALTLLTNQVTRATESYDA